MRNYLEEFPGIWDCAIRSFDGSVLEIIGGQEPSLWTHPKVLVRFTEVAYIECPTAFSHPVLRLATAKEHERISGREDVGGDDGPVLFAIDAESAGRIERQTFFVLADEVHVLPDGESV